MTFSDDVASPFGQDVLNSIFKVCQMHADRLNSRESSWLEFKESFNFGSLAKYAKTMAAFANAQGGYIVFGIRNKPHAMVGLKGVAFANLDPEKLTCGLNEVFSPEILWEPHTHEFQGKIFGLLYTRRSRNKPVVAKKDENEIKEGEVYYRYRGRSEKIKYPELMAILEERRKQEQERWMRHIERIAHIGVENAAVFDANSGEVSGAGGSFVIDESLLPKLRFVTEGQFVTTGGTPTLRLIGDVEVAKGTTILPTRKIYTTKTRGVRTDDIVLDFLKETTVDNPLEYVKQICWESSSNLPVYYYIRQSKRSLSEIVAMLEEIKSRCPSQGRLVNRLKSAKEYTLPIPESGTAAAERKGEYRRSLIAKILDTTSLPNDSRQLRYVLQAIRSLARDEVDPSSMRALLCSIYSAHYVKKTTDISAEIRDAICHLDVILYRDKVRTDGRVPDAGAGQEIAACVR